MSGSKVEREGMRGKRESLEREGGVGGWKGREWRRHYVEKCSRGERTRVEGDMKEKARQRDKGRMD